MPCGLYDTPTTRNFRSENFCEFHGIATFREKFYPRIIRVVGSGPQFHWQCAFKFSPAKVSGLRYMACHMCGHEAVKYMYYTVLCVLYKSPLYCVLYMYLFFA